MENTPDNGTSGNSLDDILVNDLDYTDGICLLEEEEEEEEERRKTFIQKQIEHPFSLGNIKIISDKNAVYERETVLPRVQNWLPQLVVFFLVNRTFLWLFLAVFRGRHDSPFGQVSVGIAFHRRYE